jgi:APA family basic amino acid/polyamine antiporter
MNTLARITSLASLSNGFVVSLARLIPEVGDGVPRALLISGALILFGLIHAAGIKFGARTIYFFTWGKLLPLIVFIIVALVVFRHNPIPASLTWPGADANWQEAAFLLLFAYAGFENMGIPAGEYKNPRKDLPFALLTGILAIAVVYGLTQLAAMSALPDLSATETPIADAAGVLMGPTGALLITIGAIISILGTNLGTMLEASRMLYALALGRSPYTVLAHIHERFRSPHVAIAVLVAIAIPVAIAGSFVTLALLSAVARLSTYLFTCAALPFLRKRSPGFRAPGGLIIPILGVLISLSLVAIMTRERLIAAAIALVAGAVLWGIGRTFGKSGPDEAMAADPAP